MPRHNDRDPAAFDGVPFVPDDETLQGLMRPPLTSGQLGIAATFGLPHEDDDDVYGYGTPPLDLGVWPRT